MTEIANPLVRWIWGPADVVVGERRSANQPRAPKGSSIGGQWISKGGLIPPRLQDEKLPRSGAFATDDPTRMANLPAAHQAAILATVQEKYPGMSRAAGDRHLDAVMRRGMADPEVRKAGTGWYDSAHRSGQRIVDDNDGVFSIEQTCGLIASTSPQQEWGSNEAVAHYMAKMVHQNPVVHLDDKHMATVAKELAKRHIDPGVINGRRLLDHPEPLVQASIIKALGKSGYGTPDGKRVSFISDVTGKVRGASWACGLNGMATGLEILHGKSPDKALSGHKVRSFFDDILHPRGKHGATTIDTHATSAWLGKKVSAKALGKSGILTKPGLAAYGTKGAYPMIADSYRRIAQKYGLLPHQAQAIIWIQWRKENP